jgi:hypothetical protein
MGVLQDSFQISGHFNWFMCPVSVKVIAVWYRKID